MKATLSRAPDSSLDPGAQGQRLRQEHSRLRDRLLELRRICAMQLSAKSGSAWQTILQHKQLVLAQIEKLNLEALFLDTQRLSGRLADDASDALLRGRDENLALLAEVVKIEDAAELSLRRQMEEINLLLAPPRRAAGLDRLYRPRSPQPSPRFLDKER